MSTRSICHIHSEWEKEGGELLLMSYYRHWDGYPSGHGSDLVELLKDKNIVNGIGANFREGIDFNGMAQLAIWLAYHMEGSVYACATGDSDMGEEYLYDVYWDGNQFLIKVTDVYQSYSTRRIPLSEWNAEDIEKEFADHYERSE